MKIKTFETNDVGKMDDLVNKFEETHNVKATQTQTVVGKDGMFWYRYTLFYKPNNDTI